MGRKSKVNYKKRLNDDRAKKAKLIAALVTTTTMMVSPVSLNFDGLNSSIQLGDIKADAATIDLLGNSNLNPVYANGKLTLTLTGTQLAGIGLVSNYYTYFQLPPELSSLLSNPNIRANTTLAYSIPILQVGPIGVPPHTGTVTGNNLLIDTSRNAIGAQISHGLASVGVAATNTFTLTIDLAALGVTALPTSPDGQLEFAARSGDNFLDVDLLTSGAASGTLDTDVGDADADADAWDGLRMLDAMRCR
ncbi:Lmo1799 family Asp-Ala repeat surface protein, partial [Listeria fleischmannii]|uniref:Lmo1799 family Asp-Ala repeat surface protein n=1 Tax=Listeria fleischmannii TaxID=1069827 RepID=UPI000DD3D976